MADREYELGAAELEVLRVLWDFKTPATVRELVAFRGWQRAQLLRRLTGWARALSPTLYRQYVRLRTRERPS